MHGHQYYWEFRYPDGSVTYDTMVVPVGRTVELEVTTPPGEVIHSWWIPALGGKIDAIPGIVNHTWFRAEEAGVYEGNCTEFCGIQHSAMEMNVRALPAGGVRLRARTTLRERPRAVRGGLREVPQPRRAGADRADAPRQPHARGRGGAREPRP